MKEIKIEKKNSGGRLDKLLFKYLNTAPSGFIYKMLRKKNIVLNDKKAAGSEILKDGDVIKLYLADDTINKFRSKPKADNSMAADAEINIKELIAYEDENIIALNKPAGLLVQKAKPADLSLNDMLLSYLGSSDTFTPGISNRLDRNTAGLVIAGKNLLSGRLLNEAVSERRLDKKYLALVCGQISDQAYLKSYIIKDEKTNTSSVISTDFCSAHAPAVPENAKLIKTAYRPLAYNERFSLLEVDLITGRSHQIRAQMSQAGHPLIGDFKYGDKKINEEIKKQYGLKSQFLCAYKIEFKNMKEDLSYLNGKVIKADLPESFVRILKGEGLWQPGLQEA